MVDRSWHEQMQGRARALLIGVERDLPRETVELVSELIDANEYGVAVEIVANVLDEGGISLAPTIDLQLADLLSDLGLPRHRGAPSGSVE